MKHETNDQFLDRLEAQRLKAQGHDLTELDRATDQERLFIKERQISILKAIYKL
jgi:hypothetical protein